LSLFLYTTSHPQIYTRSLHDALRIFPYVQLQPLPERILTNLSKLVIQNLLYHEYVLMNMRLGLELNFGFVERYMLALMLIYHQRSEEHTSELQSRENLVCRLLLDLKK